MLLNIKLIEKSAPRGRIVLDQVFSYSETSSSDFSILEEVSPTGGQTLSSKPKKERQRQRDVHRCLRCPVLIWEIGSLKPLFRLPIEVRRVACLSSACGCTPENAEGDEGPTISGERGVILTAKDMWYAVKNTGCVISKNAVSFGLTDKMWDAHMDNCKWYTTSC